MPNILKKLKSSFQHSRDQFRRIIGRYLFDIKKEPTSQQNHLERIVMVRWDAKLGDSIVSSWLLREFKKQYPSASVEVITPATMADMFKRYFGADVIHTCPKRPSYRSLKALATKIGKTDLLIHFSKQLKMKDLYFINKLKCSHVAGLDDELNCINIKLGDKTRGDHFSDKFLELANIWHCQSE
jgi:ADP-heptose:LPS heptosyltransferase